MPELKFLPNEGREGEGLSDAGIETYRADPFPAVARETSQNSRDAHDRANHPSAPVKLKIDKIEIPTHSLPGAARYREVVDHCLSRARAKGQKKELAFFQQARTLLAHDTIPVLRIEDFNTTGLRGPCEEGFPFHSLVKSSGVSNKADEMSGGSFGIGKSAVYSASDLQTVFYSTSYEEKSGERVFLCQGKTKFTSFSEGSVHYRSIGYWGDPDGYMPVDDLSVVPAWMRRTETGTTVCSVGVREAKDWKHIMIASLLVNFFRAIHENELEFAVNDVAVNRNTLRKLFDDEQIHGAVSRSAKEDFVFAYKMYDCLVDEQSTIDVFDIADAGAFQLRLQVQDGLPKRVGVLRNGMYICDNLSHFGDKFARFPMYRDFIAIVEPIDDRANAWLRRMENPRHDEFSPERLLTLAERTAARAAGAQLAEAVRERIKSKAKPATKDETNLDELSEFFALDDAGKVDTIGQRAIETFTVHKSVRKKSTRQTRSPDALVPGREGGGRPIHGDGARERNGKGSGKGEGEGGVGSHPPRARFPLLDPRTIIPNPDDLQLRRLHFTPTQSGVAHISFFSSGVTESTELRTRPSEYRISCTAGVRQMLDVRFVDEYSGPLEIVSWGSQESDA